MINKYNIEQHSHTFYGLASDLQLADGIEATVLVKNIVARLEELGMSFGETIVRGVYAKARIKVPADALSQSAASVHTTSANWRDQLSFVRHHGEEYTTPVERAEMELFSIREQVDVYQMAKIEWLVVRIYEAWGEEIDRMEAEVAAAEATGPTFTKASEPGGKQRGRRPEQMSMPI